MPTAPRSNATFDVFVSSSSGSDMNGHGTLQKPFETIEFALNYVRLLRSRQWSAATINLLNGTYYLPSPIVLSSIDSFLTIQRYRNDLVVVSGGTPLAHLRWTQTSNPNIYSAPLASGEFTTLFVGSRRSIRARMPNGNPETSGTSKWFPSAAAWLPPKKSQPAYEIHIASPTRQNTIFDAFEIGIDGPALNFEPSESYWALADPTGGGASTYRVPSGLVASASLGLPPTPYANASAANIFAMHCGYWGSKFTFS